MYTIRFIMIIQNIPLFIMIALSFGHLYIEAEEYNPYGQPEYQQPSYIPTYQPYNGPTPSAPPFEEPQSQPVKEKHVYVKEKVIKKVAVVEKKDDVDIALATEALVNIWNLFYMVDTSGKTLITSIIGTIICGGASFLCGNDLTSKTTYCAALCGTMAGGTLGFGYTKLYANKKPSPHITVTVKTEYSTY